MVPSGKQAGVYIGRVAIRATGFFNITTRQGTVQGISHRFVSRSNGSMAIVIRKECGLPPTPEGCGYPAALFMKTEEALSATVEEYLETIYNMSMEDELVIGARLAERFQVSAPTVTEMLKRLVRNGYIEMNSKRHVTLTEAGSQAAEAVLRRHRLTERFLVDMLGMQWHQVHEEACRLEHFISGAVEERVIASLNHPTTCPHGNPIPGLVNARNYLKDQHAVRLSTIPNGGRAKIICISEVVEDEEALILYLHQKGLTPGTLLTVSSQGEAQPSPEDVKLLVEEREVGINKAVAAKIWVVQA